MRFVLIPRKAGAAPQGGILLEGAPAEMVIADAARGTQGRRSPGADRANEK